jgi:hypothetical protein
MYVNDSYEDNPYSNWGLNIVHPSHRCHFSVWVYIIRMLTETDQLIHGIASTLKSRKDPHLMLYKVDGGKVPHGERRPTS